MRCLLVLLALGATAGCNRGQSKEAPDGKPSPTLRLAVVTDLKGYLEPCGCTSRPLGGIDRLAAQIRALRDGSVPLVVLMAGDLFFDTDALEPARVDQANRNASTLLGILDHLEIDAALPGRRDRAQPQEELARLHTASRFPWLAMKGAAEVVRIKAGELRIAVVGVRPGAKRDAVMAAVGSAQAETDLTIALVHGSRRDANRIGAIDGVDFVVHGGLDQDAPLPPHRAGEAWVLNAGRQGQGLTVVDLHRKTDEAFADLSEWSKKERIRQLEAQIADLSEKILEWERSKDVDPADLRAQSDRLAALKTQREAMDAPPRSPRGNSFTARWVELPKEAPTDQEVTKLMREHDKAVNQANREAFADLAPRPLGPDDIAYVGSEACGTCHNPAYVWWQSHPHGHAYLTLQTRNKEFNLDCVGCHVTGYDQPGGSTVTHNLKGALVNVGCESCHGPGAAHTKNPEIDIVEDAPESTCLPCHNEEHSDQFDYETYKKTLIVPGHGLPPVEP
ncbi:MAG: multiheme c-type cytochrome [Myxococcales bacterium]|nr:multiheme c-type cytochrome [Myxococcales bacterium]MDH3485222.1 multiheme c-type cytochrome [Myxococcales bacterium]